MKNQPPTLLTREVVLKKLGFSRSTLYKLISEGIFPKPVHLSKHKVFWLEKEINQWILIKCDNTANTDMERLGRK